MRRIRTWQNYLRGKLEDVCTDDDIMEQVIPESYLLQRYNEKQYVRSILENVIWEL